MQEILEEKVLGDITVKINTLKAAGELNMQQNAELSDLEDQEAYLIKVIEEKKRALENAEKAKETPEVTPTPETTPTENEEAPVVEPEPEVKVEAPEEKLTEEVNAPLTRDAKLRIVKSMMAVLLNSLNAEKATGIVNREYAITQTKLEEASMWFDKCLRELGIF